VAAVVADAGDRQLRDLPAIAVPDLGGGDRELVPDPFEEAGHDLPLRLQGAAVGKVEHDPEHADVHRH